MRTQIPQDLRTMMRPTTIAGILLAFVAASCGGNPTAPSTVQTLTVSAPATVQHAPVVSFSESMYTVREGTRGSLTLVLTRASGPGARVSVLGAPTGRWPARVGLGRLTLMDSPDARRHSPSRGGSAHTDVVFEAGVRRVVVPITAFPDDDLVDSTAIVFLVDPVGLTIGTPNRAIVTVVE
ncbi:MAG: hypothetical protein OXH69_01390 [Acidobacteria bacterium]|nr:hypothetical protein [Acidobacteriota bacterium]